MYLFFYFIFLFSLYVRVCTVGMCFHTEDIPRRALSIHQLSVCPLTDPDSNALHMCARNRAISCARMLVFFLCLCATIDQLKWDSDHARSVSACKRRRGLLAVSLIATRAKLLQLPSSTHTCRESGPGCGGCVILAAWWDSLWCGSVWTLKSAGQWDWDNHSSWVRLPCNQHQPIFICYAERKIKWLPIGATTNLLAKIWKQKRPISCLVKDKIYKMMS